MARLLTPQQILFIDEYIRTSNATTAYIFAYYTQRQRPEPKRTVAHACATKLLRSANVATELERRQAEMAKENGIISPIQLVHIWTQIARLNIKDMYDSDGNMLPIHKMPDHVTTSIAKISITEAVTEKTDGTEATRRTRTDIQLIDKHPALNNLADVYGIRKNGTSELMREFIKASGTSITINQTINNNQQVQINNAALMSRLKEVEHAPAAE